MLARRKGVYFSRFDGINVNEQQLRRLDVLDFMFVPAVPLAMFRIDSNVRVLTRDCCATRDEVSLNNVAQSLAKLCSWRMIAVSERCPMSQ